MSRHYSRSDVEVDRVDERRSTYASRDGGRRYDDRSFKEEIDFKRGSGPLPVREREVSVRERERSTNRGPDFLREDYGRTGAGPMVLRAREREEVEYVPRPRRRSPSPSPPKQEKEEIIIRTNERSESRGPPVRQREQSREREEIIIRRDEREREPRRPPPPPEQSREREEIIIRRDEREREPRRPPPLREQSREREEIIIRRDEREREPRRLPPPPEQSREREEIIIRKDDRESFARRPTLPREVSHDREEIIIRRDETDARSRYDDDVMSRRSYRPPPGRGEHDSREEIIIRREEHDDDRHSRVSTRRYEDDFAFDRPKSHERARSRLRSSSSASQEEIIIRRDEREGRTGDRERQEIIIRKSSRSRSRSSSPARSVRTSTRGAEPPIIYAPPIHQEVITHHRHIDHGYEVQLAPRVVSRPPSPPSPPRERSQERIEIRRSETRNGRSYDEDIIIDRNEGARSVPPPVRERERERDYYPPARREPSPLPPGYRPGWEERSVAEEAQYYNDRALSRGYAGEGYHGSTRDWGQVDVPPGTRRVRMDGAGGGTQEITWQRYNGNRRSRFLPDGDMDAGYGSELARPAPPPPAPAPLPEPEVGPRYGRPRDPRDGLWTEVTKDLVVKEALQEMGYEYEETDECYYIFKYMSYADMSRLVGLSEDIRKDRHKRINEIRWENRVDPAPAIEGGREPLAIEAPPSAGGHQWDKDTERYIEREVVYRGGRPPPPPGWRR